MNDFWVKVNATNNRLSIIQNRIDEGSEHGYWEDSLLDLNYTAYHDFYSEEYSVNTDEGDTYFYANKYSYQEDPNATPAVSWSTVTPVVGKQKVSSGENQIFLTDMGIPSDYAVFTLVANQSVIDAGYYLEKTVLTGIDSKSGHTLTAETHYSNGVPVFNEKGFEYTTHNYELTNTDLVSLKVVYKDQSGTTYEDVFDSTDALLGGVEWKTGEHFVIYYDFLSRNNTLNGTLELAKSKE
ncbi:hypothetical protein [Vibrio maerlii]|uniref:hypothetical protein n=1 Tax=Vibrio maerlii TaxID=2231648 RepID=UPI000F4D457A|nr:hypothetical protein [Vibrio maerlii]